MVVPHVLIVVSAGLGLTLCVLGVAGLVRSFLMKPKDQTSVEKKGSLPSAHDCNAFETHPLNRSQPCADSRVDIDNRIKRHGSYIDLTPMNFFGSRKKTIETDTLKHLDLDPT